MSARSRFAALVIVFVASFALVVGHAHGRSLKSKQSFKWVHPHVDSSGRYVPGHWNYIGPPKPGIKWVPGHFDRKGKWVIGRWEPVGQKKETWGADFDEEDFGE